MSKKYLRVTIMERFGVTGSFKPHTYVANKKFCERWNIAFDEQSQESLKQAIEQKCHMSRIKLISIE